MEGTLEYKGFDSILAGDVAEAWARCLTFWQKRGRIEDKPRNLHLCSYRVTTEKWLGRAFAECFLSDYQFVIDRLSSHDPIEAACAHDAIKYMIETWGPVPDPVWSIPLPLPEWVQQELADLPNRYREFHGNTLGELFRYERESEI